MIKKILLTVNVVICFSSVGFSQWIPDPTINNAIATEATRGSTANVSGVVAVPDGTGGAFIGWIDSRVASDNNIYLTRITAAGTLAGGFTAGGTAVCTATGSQSNLAMVPDGQNGVVLVWQDPRNTQTNSNDIYAARYNSDGDRLWAENGVPISTQSYSETSPAVALVSATEVVVAWRGTVNGLDLFANYVALSNGAKSLVSDITIVSEVNTQSNQAVAPDLAGGFIAVWTDGRVSNSQAGVRAQRWNAGGIKQWASDAQLRPEGLSTSNALSPAISTDFLGGAVVAWGDTRNGATNQDIYIEHVNAVGVRDWSPGTNGIQVTGATGNQSNAVLVPTTTSFVVGWTDAQNGTSNVDVYAQAYSPVGLPLWNGGAPLGICTLNDNQPASSSATIGIVPDELGNTIFVWDDRRNGGTSANEDLYAQKVAPNGALLWAAGGIPVGIRTESRQNGPAVIPSLQNSAIVAWSDNRSGNTSEIYASRIESTGVLPLSQLLLEAVVKTSSVDLLWHTTNERDLREHVVEKSTDAVKFVSIGALGAKNGIDNSYLLTDFQPLQNASYYRIKSVDNDGTVKYSNTVKIEFSTEAEVGFNIYPNPAKNMVQVRLANLPAGRYQLRMLDMQGRSLQSSSLEINERFRIMQLPLGNQIQGLVILSLTDSNGRVIESHKLLVQ